METSRFGRRNCLCRCPMIGGRDHKSSIRSWLLFERLLTARSRVVFLNLFDCHWSCVFELSSILNFHWRLESFTASRFTALKKPRELKMKSWRRRLVFSGLIAIMVFIFQSRKAFNFWLVIGFFYFFYFNFCLVQAVFPQISSRTWTWFWVL